MKKKKLIISCCLVVLLVAGTMINGKLGGKDSDMAGYTSISLSLVELSTGQGKL